MEIAALSRLMREPGRVSGAHLRMDTGRYEAFDREIKDIPGIAGVSYVGQAEASMRSEFEQGVGVMNFIYAAFAAIMAASPSRLRA